jgi:pyrroline-5-carboxylate reductase
MQTSKLTFIGAGNIAQAIIGGLINRGYESSLITASDPVAEQLQHMPGGIPHGIKVTTDNDSAVATADVVILCVKPNLAEQIARSLAPSLKNKLVISVAAGVKACDLVNWTDQATVIRCMPNTPALIQKGMIGLYTGTETGDDHRQVAESILSAVGATAWFDSEDEMDMVTAVSGSGPAYFFFVMEAMDLAAQKLGLSADASRLLVLQTALGAAEMALSENETPASLRHKVTSPGGTTEAAVNSLADDDLVTIFEKAINAAYKRAGELGK